MNKTKRKKRKMENKKAKRVDAAGEADTEKDVIALEAEAVEVVAVEAEEVVAVVDAEKVVEAVEATTTTMEAEAAGETSMVEAEASMVPTIINSNITSLTFNNRSRPTSPYPAQWQQTMETIKPSIRMVVATPMVGHGDSSPSNNGRDRPSLVQGTPLENLVHRTEQGTTTATLTPMATTV